METHLILNPAAGRGMVSRVESGLLKAVGDQLGDVQIHRTESHGHATQIAETLKQENSLVIIAGGDGTIYETVNGLVGGNCTLGIIPIGSGNDFVKMLALPLNYEKAIEVIKRGYIMKMDLGKVGDNYFANGLGMGFDADVVIESLKVKKLRGPLIYLYSVLKALQHYRNRVITLTVDGKKENRQVFMINVGNGEYLGGGFYLTPGARIDDGILDVCIIQSLSLREVLMHLPKAMKGRHILLPQVQFFRAKELIVESVEGIPVHADGELLSTNFKRVEISIVAEALKVIHNLP
jgi:diacylglycerol kinase (ATP)